MTMCVCVVVVVYTRSRAQALATPSDESALSPIPPYPTLAPHTQRKKLFSIFAKMLIFTHQIFLLDSYTIIVKI
jgi:hypothetical protein